MPYNKKQCRLFGAMSNPDDPRKPPADWKSHCRKSKKKKSRSKKMRFKS